jgi:hypothetical protein
MIRVPPQHLVPGGARGVQVNQARLLEIGNAGPELHRACAPRDLRLAPVHLAELLPAPLAGIEPPQSLERGEVGVIGLEEALQGGDGRGHVVESLLQHLRRAMPQGDGLSQIGRELGLPLEERDQLVPGLAPLGEASQVDQGGQMPRDQLQRAAKCVGGEVQVSQVLLRLLGDAPQRCHSVRGGGDGEQLLLVQGDELVPALLAPQHPLQSLPCGEVAGDELERLPEAGQRLVGAVQARVEDLRGAEVQLGPGPGIAHAGELGVVHGDERRPVLGLCVQPAEAAEGHRMARDPRQHRHVALDRLGVAVERVLEERGEPELHG